MLIGDEKNTKREKGGEQTKQQGIEEEDGNEHRTKQPPNKNTHTFFAIDANQRSAAENNRLTNTSQWTPTFYPGGIDTASTMKVPANSEETSRQQPNVEKMSTATNACAG